MDRLARRVALALADPEFAGLHQGRAGPVAGRGAQGAAPRFLTRVGPQGTSRAGQSEAEPESAVQADAAAAIPLEIYFPVPAHRAGWTGGPDILVASAREDREAPVAYDVKGRRQVLSPDDAALHPGAGHRAGGDRLRTETAASFAVTPPTAAATTAGSATIAARLACS